MPPLFCVPGLCRYSKLTDRSGYTGRESGQAYSKFCLADRIFCRCDGTSCHCIRHCTLQWPAFLVAGCLISSWRRIYFVGLRNIKYACHLSCPLYSVFLFVICKKDGFFRFQFQAIPCGARPLCHESRYGWCAPWGLGRCRRCEPCARRRLWFGVNNSDGGPADGCACRRCGNRCVRG